MEHTNPTDPDTSGARPRGLMLCLTTPGNTIDPRIEALYQPRTAPDPLRSSRSRSAYFTPTGVLTPEGRRVIHAMTEPLVTGFRSIALAARQASARFAPLAALLEEVKRGPTIGRKRRARRARGRGRAAR